MKANRHSFLICWDCFSVKSKLDVHVGDREGAIHESVYFLRSDKINAWNW